MKKKHNYFTETLQNSLKINDLVNNVNYNKDNLQNPNGFEKLQSGLKYEQIGLFNSLNQLNYRIFFVPKWSMSKNQNPTLPLKHLSHFPYHLHAKISSLTCKTIKVFSKIYFSPAVD